MTFEKLVRSLFDPEYLEVILNVWDSQLYVLLRRWISLKVEYKGSIQPSDGLGMSLLFEFKR